MFLNSCLNTCWSYKLESLSLINLFCKFSNSWQSITGEEESTKIWISWVKENIFGKVKSVFWFLSAFLVKYIKIEDTSFNLSTCCITQLFMRCSFFRAAQITDLYYKPTSQIGFLVFPTILESHLFQFFIKYKSGFLEYHEVTCCCKLHI